MNKIRPYSCVEINISTKKNIILPAIIVLVIIACTIFISDGLTYLITSLMAIAIIGTIRLNRSAVMKITRWSKANPKKAQVFIAGLQLALMALGIFAGNNFKELGYELSNTTAFVFSIIMVAGFFSVHFLPKRSTIAIPREVNKNRLAYMGIALSSFVLMVITGNRIEEMYPNSPITLAVKAIDQAIFPDNSIHADLYDAASERVYSKNFEQALTDESSNLAVFASFPIYDMETIKPPTYSKKEARAKLKAEKKASRLEKKKARMMNRLEKYRLTLAAGSSVGSVLLIILLVILTCAGVCLVVGGVAGLIDGEMLGLLAILGGAFISWQTIRGIRKVSKRDKQKNK